MSRDRHLQVIADVPTEAPQLGFDEYAKAICEAIRYGEPAQFTIGLYGKWGTGKSSLLRAIHRRLSSSDYPGVIPVDFDAWRYQRSEQIVVPLLHAVTLAIADDKSLKESVLELIKAIGMSISFRFPVVGASLSIADVRENWDKAGDTGAALDEVFAQPFHKLRAVGNALGDRRFAILIDDLDRCTADNVISVLESINIITDVAGFVFVLALDYDVLVQAVQDKYPTVSGHEFIEKIVQLPFRIPRLDAADESLIAGVIPQHARLPHLKGIDRDVTRIIDLAFEANPRSVKRFVNALGLLSRVIEIREAQVDRRILAITLGGELRWPEEFADLRTAVRAGDAQPLRYLLDADDEKLRAYVSELYPSTLDNDVLTAILRLTAAFAAEEEEDEDGSPSGGRIADQLPILIAGLEEAGWIKSARSRATYYKPNRRNTRFRVLQRVVRRERRKGPRDRWELDTSWSIARETQEAIEAAKAL